MAGTAAQQHSITFDAGLIDPPAHPEGEMFREVSPSSVRSPEDMDRRVREDRSRRSVRSSVISQGTRGTGVKSSFIQVEPSLSTKDSYRARAHWLARSKRMLVSLIVALLVNFVLICLEADREASGLGTPVAFQICTALCFIVYVVDYSCRIVADRWGVLKGSLGWTHAIVILAGFAEYGFKFAGVEHSLMLVLLKFVRLGRVFNLVVDMGRFRFLREIRWQALMMATCIKTLVWSFLLCFMIMTLWSVLAVELLRDRLQEMVDGGAMNWRDCERCGRAFASVMDSNLTLFQTIVAGDSWGLVAIPLIEAHPWSAIIFIGAMMTVVFGVLNLIVAVVVERFADARAKDINTIARDLDDDEQLEKKELERIFKKIDQDLDGTLTRDELLQGAQRVREFRNMLRVLDIDSSDLEQLFEVLDADGSGAIEPQEFTEALYRMRHAKAGTVAAFLKFMVGSMDRRQQSIEETFKEAVHTRGSEEAARNTVPTVAEEQVVETVKDYERSIANVVEATLNQAAKVALEEALKAAFDSARSVMGVAAKRTSRIMANAEDVPIFGGSGSARGPSMYNSENSFRAQPSEGTPPNIRPRELLPWVPLGSGRSSSQASTFGGGRSSTLATAYAPTTLSPSSRNGPSPVRIPSEAPLPPIESMGTDGMSSTLGPSPSSGAEDVPNFGVSGSVPRSSSSCAPLRQLGLKGAAAPGLKSI